MQTYLLLLASWRADGSVVEGLYALGAATGGLRLSPHVYNTMSDIELAIRGVRRFRIFPFEGHDLAVLPQLRAHTATAVAQGTGYLGSFTLGTLADSTNGATGSLGRMRSGRFLVSLQLALSLPLLVGAGLLIRTFDHLMRLPAQPSHSTG